MGKVLIGIIGIVVGAIIGTIFGGALIGGTAAGAGIATGLSAGICSTVQAAQDEGLLTGEQVDQILNRAAVNLSEMSGTPVEGEIVGTVDNCADVMEQLRAAGEG